MPEQKDRWSVWFLLVFQIVAVLVIARYLPACATDVFPAKEKPLIDFTQDWVSARNYYEGRSIYAPHAETYPRYFDLSQVQGPLVLGYNAHPPGSVLVILPVGRLDFFTALAIWHVVSLLALGVAVLVIVRELQFPVTAWNVLPAVAFFFLWSPFRQQLMQGQWHLMLLVLLVLGWAAYRRQWDVSAGIFLGLAMAVKLFPGLLVLLFLLHGRWKAVVAATVTYILLTAATLLLFGWETYRDYLVVVMHDNTVFYGNWNNSSLTGFWYKLLVGGGAEKVIPLIYAPTAARIGTILCSGLVLLLFVIITLKLKHFAFAGAAPDKTAHLEARDQAYALTMTAMLLLSPITWDHSVLLLLFPGCIFWRTLAASRTSQYIFLFLVLGLSLVQDWGWQQLMAVNPWTHAMGPALTLTLLSLPFYGLMVFYVAQWMQAWKSCRAANRQVPQVS